MESETEEGGKTGPGNPRLEQALEHPLRARMLAELNKRMMSVPELAVALNTPLSIAAYHYQVLAELGGMCPRDTHL